MLNSFQDFLSQPLRYKNICNNTEMEHVYDNILSRSDNIIKMINAINNDIAPVSICAKEVEAYISTLTNSTITLDRNVDTAKADNYRQAVGAMIAFILKPFGYEKIKGRNRPIPALYKGAFFSSGATYALTGPATMKLVQKLVSIDSED
ncbi:hypothetical protein [Acetobacterium malicum]|uniref:hypothetical protein n=1 Tax=Acetobacterium malicum TaxID=52692 RepID=UPI0035940B02